MSGRNWLTSSTCRSPRRIVAHDLALRRQLGAQTFLVAFAREITLQRRAFELDPVDDERAVAAIVDRDAPGDVVGGLARVRRESGRHAQIRRERHQHVEVRYLAVRVRAVPAIPYSVSSAVIVGSARFTPKSVKPERPWTKLMWIQSALFSTALRKLVWRT